MMYYCATMDSTQKELISQAVQDILGHFDLQNARMLTVMTEMQAQIVALTNKLDTEAGKKRKTETVAKSPAKAAGFPNDSRHYFKKMFAEDEQFREQQMELTLISTAVEDLNLENVDYSDANDAKNAAAKVWEKIKDSTDFKNKIREEWRKARDNFSQGDNVVQDEVEEVEPKAKVMRRKPKVVEEEEEEVEKKKAKPKAKVVEEEEEEVEKKKAKPKAKVAEEAKTAKKPLKKKTTEDAPAPAPKKTVAKTRVVNDSDSESDDDVVKAQSESDDEN